MAWSCVLLLSLTSSALQEWYIHTCLFLFPVGKQMKVHISPMLHRKVLFWAPSRTNSSLVILQSEDNVRLCHILY